MRAAFYQNETKFYVAVIVLYSDSIKKSLMYYFINVSLNP